MRTIPLLIVLMLAAVVGLAIVRPGRVSAGEEHQQAAETVRKSLETIRQHVLLQSALVRDSHRVRGHPPTIEPGWFADGIPVNPWFGPRQPWIEIARTDQPGIVREAPHPPCIVALEPTDGTFWYDPTTGVVRARVPPGLMDEEAIALYNAVNGTDVTSVLP